MPKKKDESSKNVPAKAPELENTPLKFWKNEGDEHLSVALPTSKDGSSADFIETLKSVIGVKDTELAAQILSDGVVALQITCGKDEAYNVALQSLHDLKPKDAIEARFALQASALFSHGMSNLSKSAKADMMCHADHYSNKAIKLLRLHNETIEALTRYRRGGEQKVTVTHAIITEKAIVNNFNGVGGVSTKNEGESPCSSQNAAQKPEQMTISHVDNQQWPTVDADCMEVKASALKQKKAESA